MPDDNGSGFDTATSRVQGVQASNPAALNFFRFTRLYFTHRLSTPPMPRQTRLSPAFRKRHPDGRFDFLQLEPRQMLAANLTSGLQVPNDLPAGTNLVVNGEFELFQQGTAVSVTNDFATARFLPGDQVTGFDVIDGDGDGNSVINLQTFANDRGTILDLDSLPGQDDRIFQDIATAAGQEYLLAFDFRNSPLLGDNTDTSTNDFEVFWNGVLIASMTGGDFWQTAALTVIGASDNPDADVAGDEVLSRLEFRDGREGDRGGDGRGALIHCVRLTAVTATDVVNGGFEDVGSGTGPNFSPDDVAGFSVFNFADDAQPRVIQVNEFQPDEIPVEGENYLSINSDNSVIDQVFQDIATEAGRTYYVTFQYRTDPDSSGDPDQLRVRWNDAWAATFIGTSEWQSVGILLDADSDLTRLNFREAGEDTGDGAGVHIDDVQIFVVDQIVNDLAIDLQGSGSGTLATSNFIEDGPAVEVAPNLVISRASGTNLSSATVALLGVPAESTELLAVSADAALAAGLTAQYDAALGVLTLQGNASLQQYQTVLRTVNYQNASDAFAATTREIGFQVTDEAIEVGGTSSPQAVATVTLTQQNDAPTLAAIEDITAGFGQTVQFQTVANDLDGDDLSFAVSVAGLAATQSQPTISEDGEFSLIATQAGTFDITVTATDAAQVVTQQQFSITVNEFVPFEGVGALSNIPVAQRLNIYTEAPPFNIDTDNTFDAVLETDAGTIEIRLLDDESPTFVNNFVNLARDGFYDGLIFHRVIDGFVAQGGDPEGTGTGGPGFQIPDEVGNTIPFNSRGQLSFANSGNNTTGSQFFITFDQTNLSTGQFSVFGNVTAGDDVLDQIVRTATSTVFGEIPIEGAVATVVNSITIVETPSEIG